MGKPDGKRPLGEDNIKMDMREADCDAVHWIYLAQDRDQWQAYVRAE